MKNIISRLKKIASSEEVSLEDLELEHSIAMIAKEGVKQIIELTKEIGRNNKIVGEEKTKLAKELQAAERLLTKVYSLFRYRESH